MWIKDVEEILDVPRHQAEYRGFNSGNGTYFVRFRDDIGGMVRFNFILAIRESERPLKTSYLVASGHGVGKSRTV